MKNKRTKEKDGMLGRDEKDDRWERIFNKQSVSGNIMTRCI